MSSSLAQISRWISCYALAAGATLAFAPTISVSYAASLHESEHGQVQVEELVQGLEHPWAMAFLPEGAGVLITERPGRLRIWRPDAGLSEPIAGVPDVYSRSQGGLLDLVLTPD